ncbi:ribonuclease H2 non-catalytic subunit-domain-containing protein [Podospora appendiculata]|uniref:Ribonuclease H2 non-catalytic subunit-domain-containing protein n=1 Tax=Podospora appendiculata TaxID=314037 RepID=A0AAE0X7T1_9PEZI|nr:ribonuclease H2 non-catalytic subunit-domain-containing protein [Podospora appendiculata]
MSQSQPILALTPPQNDKKSTPHLLPCRVHLDAPVAQVQSFWEPRQAEDGTSTAYFRGRKLCGKTVKLPDGYRGVVAAKADDDSTRRDPEDDEKPETGSLQVEAEFDDMVIWNHEVAPDVAADPYVRGMEEWLALADQIHSYPAAAAAEK